MLYAEPVSLPTSSWLAQFLDWSSGILHVPVAGTAAVALVALVASIDALVQLNKVGWTLVKKFTSDRALHR